jgi:hypothetical protein
MELLHRLAELSGKYCDFDPITPLKGVRSLHGYKGLVDSIKAIGSSNRLWFTFPILPQAANNSLKGNFNFELMAIISLHA